MPTTPSDHDQIVRLEERLKAIDDRLKTVERAREGRAEHTFLTKQNFLMAVSGLIGAALVVAIPWLLQR